MSEFTTALIVSPLADGKSWVLLQDLKYHIGSIDNRDCVVAAHGFVTDFASVPRIFWWIIPKWGKYGNAAVIHDWLYYRQTAKNRVESDQILYEAMGVLGVVPWKKNSI
ncbi:MAG: phage tail protein, partial [Desulfobulbus sp.]